ncbi:MAG: ATP-binding protein [Candidatus Omnitrophica bacterium]|nr:ATP-binding protein [Candidatus Omnitrophota bacterium]
MRLLERAIIPAIKKRINTPDILVLHGARQVGKTSILKYLQHELKQQKKNVVYIDLEDLRFVQIINSGIDDFLKYLTEHGYLKKARLYLFIDEVQYLKNPSNFLKLMRDHYSGMIKLFVSGSSSFEIKSKFKESLVGRTINFEIFPLNFAEFLYFKKCDIDLNRKQISKATTEELKKLYKEYVCYGGYPRIVLELVIANKELYLQQIIDTYIRKDIRDLANIKDIMKFNKLLEILAAQSGNLLNIVELANTTRLARPTVEHYLFLMENTYIIKMLSPFSTNLRSELFKTPKIFFYDTGIAHLLWLKSLPRTIIGNMFETSILSELVKDGTLKELFHWRTQDKKEIDFIVRKGRKIIPLEVKNVQSSFNFTAMRYFLERYKIKSGICIALEIEKRKEKQVEFIYPWELANHNL